MNSMTGFGRAIASLPSTRVRVEISGVNRKQAEIAINVPRPCSEWEQLIRPIVLQSISRGRVGISVTLENSSQEATGNFHLDEVKVKELIAMKKAAWKLIPFWEKRIFTLTGPTMEDLIRLGIISTSSSDSIDSSESWPAVEEALKTALNDFLSMRKTEGSNMKQDLLSRIAILEKLREQIMETAPDIPKKLGDAMKQRLADLGIPVDLNDDRLIREIALFADKCDISEETARLASHFSQFKSICDGDAPAGRPLDFLCQEIFREFNTIGSKANDASLAHLVVSAKTELEKVREQVQNIE